MGITTELNPSSVVENGKINKRATKVYELGDNILGPSKTPIQNYDALKKKHGKGSLFEDPAFPLPRHLPRKDKTLVKIEWLRPPEICESPNFFASGTRHNIKQGALKNCWFVAAAGCLTLQPDLLKRVVMPSQNFKNGYAGIFSFRFWQCGKWVEVVIDDRLPTVLRKPFYTHSADGNEFWACLLEKAYAKFYGSYDALIKGQAKDAMQNFTGGITEMLKIKSTKDVHRIMFECLRMKSMLACSIEASYQDSEKKTPQGLVLGHSYSITDVRTIKKVEMIRLRNPWGEEEWNGDYSRESNSWSSFSQAEKTRLGVGSDLQENGEFWMKLHDFERFFTDLEICHTTPAGFTKEEKKQYSFWYFDGAWVKGLNAGGCSNYPNTFHINPQFRFKIDGDDREVRVIISLLQKYRRRMRTENLTIGFSVYHVPTELIQAPALMKNFPSILKTVEEPTPLFFNNTEIARHMKLKPGTYCVIPSTFKPFEEGDFFIRILIEKRSIKKKTKINLDMLFETPVSQVMRENGKKKWNVSYIQGKWIAGKNAGGCFNNIEFFKTNTQYRIKLQGKSGKHTVILHMMQKLTNDKLLHISFSLFKVPNEYIPTTKLDANFFKYNRRVEGTPTFINSKEVQCTLTLEPGIYCLIPSTFQPNQAGSFALRILIEDRDSMVKIENSADGGNKDFEDLGYGWYWQPVSSMLCCKSGKRS